MWIHYSHIGSAGNAKLDVLGKRKGVQALLMRHLKGEREGEREGERREGEGRAVLKHY